MGDWTGTWLDTDQPGRKAKAAGALACIHRVGMAKRLSQRPQPMGAVCVNTNTPLLARLAEWAPLLGDDETPFGTATGRQDVLPQL